MKANEDGSNFPCFGRMRVNHLHNLQHKLEVVVEACWRSLQVLILAIPVLLLWQRLPMLYHLPFSSKIYMVIFKHNWKLLGIFAFTDLQFTFLILYITAAITTTRTAATGETKAILLSMSQRLRSGNLF
jgi:hypothetical protein